MAGAVAAPIRAKAGEPVVRIDGLSKRFGTRLVLSDVALSVEPGQVHALLGANGAGKSSLVKILAGYHARTTGIVSVGGTPAPPSAGVAEMTALGVRVVHQDLGLVDGMSVLENIAVAGGYRRGRFGQIDWRATARRVEAALDHVGLRLDPEAGVDGLPTWQRVAVACARALYDGLGAVRLLILDEVTAALPPAEVVLILDIVRRLQASGAGILYVTHRFEDVVAVADWVSVLRDGRLFASRALGTLTAGDLVEHVVGHRVKTGRTVRCAAGRAVLRLEAVSTARLRRVSLTVRAGEICGIIGRAGCGRSALGRAVFGQDRLTGGRIMLDGTPLAAAGPRDAIRRGIAYVPQDRHRGGILPGATVRENLSLASLRLVSRRGVLSGPREARLAARLVERYGITPPDAEAAIETLSGGNQQKVVVGRWETGDIVLLILDEPTEGVDAGARDALYRIVRQRAAAGIAVLLLSSSVEEVIEVCDRALVLRDGALDAEIVGPAMTVQTVETCLMAGA